MEVRHLLYLLLLSSISSVVPLTCESCQLTKCPVISTCKAGMVMDVCNCCPVCAQAQGESCGGKFGLNGKCGFELYCYLPYNHTSGVVVTDSRVGRCKACGEVIYSGCSIIQGVCQCGDSCTHPFDYSSRETCTNSVKAYGDSSNYCETKICPQSASEEQARCPEDSYRPPAKLSLDGCCKLPQRCQCLQNKCHVPPACPAGKRVAEMNRGNGLPGTCCSQYTCVNATTFRCLAGNSTFTDGQSVNRDQCVECKCKDSLVSCYYMKCDTPSCEWSALAPGKCCPECRGCISTRTGESYSNGESWEEQDACVSCQCTEGQSHCTASSCERRCRNPKKVLGQCCPVCEEDEVIYQDSRNVSSKIVCPDDATCPSDCIAKVTVEINGCPICLCEDDINMCLGSASCSKLCPHGYKKDRELGCSYCRCNACAMFSCNVACADGYVKDGVGCNKCECKGSKVLTPVSVCFTSEGKTYTARDTWFDGCRECYCENGREMCSLISCPTLSCSQPVSKAGDCCPSCASDSSGMPTLNVSMSCMDADGSPHREGEVWQLDSCTACICHEGQALCETRRCPPTLCTHPVKDEGDCCARCSEVTKTQLKMEGKRCTTLSGTTFDHRSIWKVGDCQSCTCQDGAVTCYSQVCPSLSCKTTVQQKGQCCPKCTAQGAYDKICVYGGVWYKHLDTWENDNLQCTCIHGQAECESVECSSCTDDDDRRCCSRNEGSPRDKESTLPFSVGLPMIIVFSVLLLLFAAAIVLLSIAVVRQRRKDRSTLTAIPKILEKRAITNAHDALIKKRPKSTNLEFLHSTNDNRYNHVMNKGDTDCFRPLVEQNHHGNEYIQC